ncbi:MAG: hypothetical protein ACPHV3_06025 [Vibrio sp.]
MIWIGSKEAKGQARALGEEIQKSLRYDADDFIQKFEDFNNTFNWVFLIFIIDIKHHDRAEVDIAFQ